jgi:hypothetical protein
MDDGNLTVLELKKDQKARLPCFLDAGLVLSRRPKTGFGPTL